METVDIKNISFNEKGLVPAIVQDARSGEILMMAYMNQESLQKTIETGETWFFSRSRQKLWHKGEESAHFQHVKRSSWTAMRIPSSCRSFPMALPAIRIIPPASSEALQSGKQGRNRKPCDPSYSFEEIKDRRAHPQDKSYTNYLQSEGKTRSTRRSAKKPLKSSSPTSIKTKKRS